MKKSYKILAALLIIFVLAGSGFAYYTWKIVPAKASTEPAYQTAKVRKGDIRITASGAGTLVSASETRLGFRSPGLLSEIYVKVGDEVEVGQVLARLDDTAAHIQYEQARINLEALTSPSIKAEAGIAVLDTQKSLEKALETRASQQYGARASQTEIDKAKAELVLAEAKMTAAWEKYEPLSGNDENDVVRAAALAEYSAAVLAHEAASEKLEWYFGFPTEQEQAILDADVHLAEAKLAAAQAYLAELNDDVINEDQAIEVNQNLTQLRQAKLSLQNAELTLANTKLYAPVSGTITRIDAITGEIVGTNPIMTLSNLNQPFVRFFVEESDLGKIAVGNPVIFTFDAYPDEQVTGKVVIIEPVLAVVEGTPVVAAWAELDGGNEQVLLSGMAAETEVVSGESTSTLLVPVQALRELDNGSYAVFVVDADGQLKLTPVEVGLMDFTNAEILGGLSAGDVVSTGTVETK